MKSLVVIFALSAFVLYGCATPKGTKEDYFGYNNSPIIPENTDKPVASSKPKRSAPPIDTTTPLAYAPKDDWVNPMATDDDPQEDYNDDVTQQRITTAGYQPYSSPQYVPVIVPWWDSYSGWMGGCYSRPVVVMRYRNWYWGWNSYCDWYSPYYDFHPWYGGNFSYYRPRYYGWNRPFWRPWQHYPIYTYSNPTQKPNSVRSWGPTRGEVPPASGGIRGTVATPTPTSGTPSVRNERGRTSDGTPSKSTTTTPESSTSTPAVRNVRGASTSATPSSGNQHPLRRNEVSTPTETPKSGTTSTPVRNERTTKEAAPTPKSDPKPSSSGTSAPRQERSSAPSQSASPAPRSATPSAAPSTPTTTSPRGTRKP